MSDYNEMSLDELVQHAGITLLPDDEYEPSVSVVIDRRRAARDAILDMAERLDAEGLVVVPREPTPAMWEAGREPILHHVAKSPPEMVVRRSWFDPTKDMPPREDGHSTKGDAAVWTYRAMLAAAPLAPEVG